MGGVGSKSPLERRNTVLRRSQRKSIHGVKSKADKIIKDIKKFKGTEENQDYIELKTRIEQAERELNIQGKSLQPQVNYIYNETLKKTQGCHKLLSDKLLENQSKVKEVVEVQEEHNEDDDVFVEEIQEEVPQPESPKEKKPIQLTVIQVESMESSPQVNKRFSAAKYGVPVLPGSIMESINRKMDEHSEEEKLAEIKDNIQDLEMEINEFVGRRNGKQYNAIMEKLQSCSKQLKNISGTGEEVQEEVKRCEQYIASCMSFLLEKAVVDDGTDDQDISSQISDNNSNLSPRSIRTTYI